MKRKLSSIEHMIDGNIVYFIRLEGSFHPGRLRSALLRVQRKHPALRMLIRKERDGLYYEADCAPEIPLRILPRLAEDHYRHEAMRELRTAFLGDQPQLRTVWLRSEREQDLLLTTSHRICDGMSMLTIVREVLRSIHTDEELIPYPEITTRDIIGDYQPPRPWKRNLIAHLVNGVLRLVPASRQISENNEYCLEWSVDRELSDALRRRCKAEGISVHAALMVALDRALLAVCGKKKLPAWIESPMDARRGRIAALKSDMLFFGGGSLKLRTGQASEVEFWPRARAVHKELRERMEQELLNIPGRYHFFEMLHPMSNPKIHTLVRLGDALKINGSWNRFALSNLGNIVVTSPDAPFHLKDLRPYVHSFNIRLLGLVSYVLNGEMRFYYVGDEKCMSRSKADALRREIMILLENHLTAVDDREMSDAAEVGLSLRAADG